MRRPLRLAALLVLGLAGLALFAYGPRGPAAARPGGADVTPSAASAPPHRIASLNLTADEILVEILPPDRLVAVTAFVDEPGKSNAVGRAPAHAVRFARVDMERLVALAPDLVVVSEYTDADALRQLERSGIRHHRMSGLGSLPGMRAALRELGRAVGEGEGAGRLAARFDARLAELERRLAGAPRPRVLYWAGGMAAGGDTAIGALMEAAGARNVGRELGLEGITMIGAERAFLADPDAVLIGTWPGTREALLGHPLLARMRAVRERRVIELPTERLVALSHHAADAAWELAARLHPERVPARAPAVTAPVPRSMR